MTKAPVPIGKYHKHIRRNQRRKEAAERQRVRDARGAAQQLRLIIERPGNSAREKERIS